MNNVKVKEYKKWYYVFLILGLFGLCDIIIGVLIKQFGFENGGDLGLTFLIVHALKYLFGAKIAESELIFSP